MEQTLFSKMGIQYTERDGLYYPILPTDLMDIRADIGKYGRLWMHMLFEYDRKRYNKLLLDGTIIDQAIKKNEEAYEIIDKITQEYLGKLGANEKHSSIAIWKCRTAAVITGEELFLECAFRNEKIRKYNADNCLLQNTKSED